MVFQFYNLVCLGGPCKCRVMSSIPLVVSGNLSLKLGEKGEHGRKDLIPGPVNNILYSTL